MLEPTIGGKPVALGDPGKPLNPGAVPGAPTSPTGRPGAAAAKAPAIDGLHVRGLYLVNPDKDDIVTQFEKNLAGSSLFKLDKNDRLVILNRDPQNEKDWAFAYELQLTLAKPQPLD